MASLLSFFAGIGFGAGLVGFSKFYFNTSDYVRVTGNSSITINGKTFNGNNIFVSNGKVIVDGNEQSYSEGNKYSHTYKVEITGNPQKVETMGDVSVSGDCGYINTMGNVNVRQNSGNINTMGVVTVGGTSGKINTLGTVNVSKR